MIPILYEKDETAFTSEGLGRLSDALFCKVIHSFTGMYELEMDYPITGIHYEDLEVDRIILAKPETEKNPQPMRIYQISSPDLETITVYARHWCYQLNYLPVRPFTATNVTEAIQKLGTNSIEYCPFTFSCTFTSGDTDSEVATENVGNRFTLEGLTVDTTYYLYLYAVNVYGVQQTASVTGTTSSFTSTHTAQSTATSDAAPIINDFWVASSNSNSITVGFDVSGAMPMQLYLGYWTASTYVQQVTVPMSSTGSVTTEENAFSFDEPRMIRTVLGGEEDSIIAKWGGEVDWDMDQVILKDRIGSDNGVFIRYAKNLTGLNQELNSESCYSGAFGYYYKKGTEVDAAESESETSEAKDKTVLILSPRIYDFGTETATHMKRIYLADLTEYFDDLYKDEKDDDGNTRVPTAEEVYDATVAYAQENGLRNISVSITVDFLDLSKTSEFEGRENLESVSLGDTIYVQYPNMNVNFQARVSETDYDVLLERYNSITIGEPSNSVADATLGLFGNYYNVAGYGKRESVLMDGLGNFSSIAQTAEQISLKVSKADAISSQQIYYLATSANSGVTTSTAGWTSSPQAIDATNKYLWTYVLYTYADGHTSTSSPVISGVYGDAGSAGKGIVSITPLYRSYRYDGTTYSPPKPTSEVTDTGKTANTWTKALPIMNSTYQYLFTCNQIEYTDGSFSWTDVIRDEATENAVAAATYTEILQSTNYIQSIAQDGAAGLASIINQTAAAITLDASNINLVGMTNVYYDYNGEEHYLGSIGPATVGSDWCMTLRCRNADNTGYHFLLVSKTYAGMFSTITNDTSTYNRVQTTGDYVRLSSGSSFVSLHGKETNSSYNRGYLNLGRSGYLVDTVSYGNIRPGVSSSYTFGDSSYLWSTVYTKKIASGSNNLILNANNNNTAYMDEYGFYPYADNDYLLGYSARRWKAVYAVNGTIQTSDRTVKKNITYDMTAHLAIFDAISPTPYMFTYKRSDRTHLGFIAQDVEGALEENGMTAMDFGGFCKDLNEETGEYDYSLRYSEFVPLNTAAIKRAEAKIEAQESKIAQLESEVSELKDLVRQLLGRDL